MGDYDELTTPAFSTGYVPTTLLVQDGVLIEKFAGNDIPRIRNFVEAA